MKDSQRLAGEFRKLFNGQSWIDVNIMDTLTPLTSGQAAAKPFSHANSIWEIVNHLISWRETILKRMQGDLAPSPENNFFEPVRDHAEAAWQKTLQQFQSSQYEWMNTIDGVDDDWLEVMWEPGSQSRYELIQGILQHDSYHLGQIVILKKFV